MRHHLPPNPLSPTYPHLPPVRAASVSFGAPRDFLLRRNSDATDKYCFALGGGSLLVMRGTLQDHWLHSVPKRRAAAGEGRISLTFRRIVRPEQPR